MQTEAQTSPHYETLQQVFDDAYRGLAAQGFLRSQRYDKSWGMACAYRGEDGLKCAIGHCIPDEAYAVETEMQSPEGTGFQKHYGRLFRGVNASQLSQLQKCHDEGDDPALMRRLLTEFADARILTIPALPA